MASFFQRSNGFYYAVSCDDGKRRWQSLKTKDFAEAREAFRRLGDLRKKKSDYRISYFMEEFEERMGLMVARSTLLLYLSGLANLRRLCGDLPLREITPDVVERFKVLREKEVKPVTVNIDLRSLRVAFNDAMRLHVINENPFQGTRMLRLDDAEAPFLNEKEIQRLCQVIDDQNFRQLVMFGILTCMRRGEIIHLEWEDVDIERQEIHIRNKSDFRVKGGRPRTIPMHHWVHEWLRQKNRNSRYVFSDSMGLPLKPSTVSHKFKAYVLEAGLNARIHFHTLRHTGISRLQAYGVPQAEVQRIAGHTSLKTTDIYTHFEREHLHSAINTMPILN